MKKILLYSLILIPAFLWGHTLKHHLQQEVNSGQITEAAAAVYEFLAAHDPGLLPDAYQALADETPLKSGFRLNLHIQNQWHALSENDRALLKSYMMRPSRSTLPESYISASGLFKIHYTNVLRHAVPQADDDGSGIPDYVEFTAAIMDSVYQVEVIEFGLQPPPDDQNTDGPEWDVYLKDLNMYGETMPETRISNNPDIWISYLSLDNDFDGGYFTSGENALRVTAAHEFFHMIQLGYNFRSSWTDLFLMEMGSTWMEDAVFDQVNDYYQYLGPPYRTTGMGLFEENNQPFNLENGWHEYGMCLWFHFLEKRFEHQLAKGDMVRRVWEAIVDVPALQALDRVMVDLGSSFQDELSAFYAWNYRTGSRADTVNFYPEGNAYPEIVTDGHYSFYFDTTLSASVEPMAARYFQFDLDNEDYFALIPVNHEWYNPDTANTVVLAVMHEGERGKVTTVGGDAVVRLVTESGFHCSAFASESGVIDYVPSIDPASFSGQDDLPASYPNPFRPAHHRSTAIPFQLHEPGLVHLGVFTANGLTVYHEEAWFASGVQQFNWNGCNESGNQTASGIYFYVIWNKDGEIRREKLAIVR